MNPSPARSWSVVWRALTVCSASSLTEWTRSFWMLLVRILGISWLEGPWAASMLFGYPGLLLNKPLWHAHCPTLRPPPGEPLKADPVPVGGRRPGAGMWLSSHPETGSWLQS